MLMIIIRSLFLVLKFILSFYVGFTEDSNSMVYKCDVFVINVSFLNCNKGTF